MDATFTIEPPRAFICGMANFAPRVLPITFTPSAEIEHFPRPLALQFHYHGFRLVAQILFLMFVGDPEILVCDVGNGAVKRLRGSCAGWLPNIGARPY
jgi:hypothetical protein